MPSVLVIDDDPEILSANVNHLGEQGFDVTTADTGMSAIALLNEKRFDCIVLDVMLPDIDGFAICKAARTVTDAPIIFLTCLDELDDKIKGLLLGGDDYMTKPYSLKELTVRIHAILRRQERMVKRHGGNIHIDKQKRMIHTPGKNVFLSHMEFELFLLFFENPGALFAKEDIEKRLWPEGGSDGAVAVLISKLRRKLKFTAPYIGNIENTYGMGYTLKPPAKMEQA
ncbi:MAG: response regulator transcription factor [Holophagales bacterium]|jgi:DNA-binding response OmpR family regulator|nr:response regulator transcription factor [Holophagales bacterium]